MVLPSPSDQVTLAGVAVAVTDSPGTAAVAEAAPQPVRSSHNHVGKFTNCRPAGDSRIAGDGSRNWSYAARANAAGSGKTGPAAAGASGMNTGGRKIASATPLPVHLYTYQAPFGAAADPADPGAASGRAVNAAATTPPLAGGW